MAPAWLEHLKPIPRVNTPSSGPPTRPKTANDACKTVEPKAFAMKVVAIHTRPYPSAINFKTSAPCLSSLVSWELNLPENFNKCNLL